MTPSEREQFLQFNPEAAPIVDSVAWMRRHTHTWDEHDVLSPHKRLPDYPYFDELHRLFHGEDTLFIEKSRTVMATWWAAGECLHYVMTRQPASCIFWCPDEARAIKCIKYCKVFWDKQDDWLKGLFPLSKPLDQQAVYSFVFADGGTLEALPGMNPNRIRSEHPTIVCMDEAAENPNGAEAYANALATRPKKLLAFSSAYPGWFYDLLQPAVPINP